MNFTYCYVISKLVVAIAVLHGDAYADMWTRLFCMYTHKYYSAWRSVWCTVRYYLVLISI
jgi:hypothetical protein